jgi:hypothetical protein
MTNSQIDDILISLGWEKLLRKDHLVLFRKYDHDLQVYAYKSKLIFIENYYLNLFSSSFRCIQ